MSERPTTADLSVAVLTACRKRGIMLATAESCTGGMIAAALTDIAGSSAVVDRGFVTYSNEAKMQMLGVSPRTLEQHGAVSEATAREMATGALAHSAADLTVAITGVAGPGGGSDAKPVGLVHFAAARKGGQVIAEHHLFGDIGRTQVREAAVMVALQLLRRLAGN